MHGMVLLRKGKKVVKAQVIYESVYSPFCSALSKQPFSNVNLLWAASAFCSACESGGGSFAVAQIFADCKFQLVTAQNASNRLSAIWGLEHLFCSDA